MAIRLIKDIKIKATRKEHYCCWCGGEIKKGSPAHYRVYIFDGDFIYDYLHEDCYKAMDQSKEEVWTFGEHAGVAIR